MTRRLLLSYLGLAVLILVVLEVPLAVLAARHERDLMAYQSAREAAGLAGLVSEDMEHLRVPELSTLATTYRNSTGGEVAIVAPSGALIASSSGDVDNDVTGTWHHLIELGLNGVAASRFASDEGKPFAAAVAPVTVDNQPRGVVLLSIPASAAVQRIHNIWWALGGLAGGVLLLTAGIGVVLARSVSRPLGRLTEAVGALGAGDLRARAAVDRGPPQVRELAAEFNHMAARLAELVEAQSRFVADASHQLRSPLTALRLRLENLEADSGEVAADGIAAAGLELQRLSRVVDGLLTLSRAGQDEPRKETIDIEAVISDRCQAWAALADEKGIALVGSSDQPGRFRSSLVPGDLDQILDNLIANSFDASPAGATISVSVESAPRGQARIHVSDQGPGMTEEDRRRAFDRFWTGGSSNGGHSGLGLAIVRQLAGRNDASVELIPAEPTGLDAVVVVPALPSTRGRHVDQEEVS